MPSQHSLRRLARLTKRVHRDLRKGGMAMTFAYIFRATAVLARVVTILAEHVAEQAGEEEARRKEEGAGKRAPVRSRRETKTSAR